MAERELEVNRLPIAVVGRDMLKPAAKIRTQILDLRFPYARNRGGKLLFILGCGLIQHRVCDRQCLCQ